MEQQSPCTKTLGPLLWSLGAATTASRMPGPAFHSKRSQKCQCSILQAEKTRTGRHPGDLQLKDFHSETEVPG